LVPILGVKHWCRWLDFITVEKVGDFLEGKERVESTRTVETLEDGALELCQAAFSRRAYTCAGNYTYG
jgi:hypothetical protein